MTRVQAYVDRQRFLIEFCTGKRVLDCGVIGQTELEPETRINAFPGGLHWQIAEVATETVGTDYDAALIAEVHTAHPHLRLVAANMETIRLDETFDVVVMGDLIEHLSNPGLALDRVQDLLTHDGRLVITCPNALGLPNYLRFVTRRFREGGDHVVSFNEWTLSNLLIRHGFTVEETLTCLDRPSSSVVVKLLSRVLRLIPRFGGTLLVVAAVGSR